MIGDLVFVYQNVVFGSTSDRRMLFVDRQLDINIADDC